jgi:hypothetical protein
MIIILLNEIIGIRSLKLLPVNFGNLKSADHENNGKLCGTGC